MPTCRLCTSARPSRRIGVTPNVTIFITWADIRDGVALPLPGPGASTSAGKANGRRIAIGEPRRDRSVGELERLNRLYAVLSQVNQAVVRARSKDELFNSICQVAVRFGQFRLVWIGSLEEGSGALTLRAKDADEQGFPHEIPGKRMRCGAVRHSGRAAVHLQCADGRRIERDVPWARLAIGDRFLRGNTHFLPGPRLRRVLPARPGTPAFLARAKSNCWSRWRRTFPSRSRNWRTRPAGGKPKRSPGRRARRLKRASA